MKKKEIDRIMKKYKEAFKILEEYDRTHKLPFQRERLYITLSNKAIDRLKEMSAKTGRPISRIIEKKVMS